MGEDMVELTAADIRQYLTAPSELDKTWYVSVRCSGYHAKCLR